MSDYLFDKSGEPDPEVERLERLLGRYRFRAREAEDAGDRPPRARRRLARWIAPLALAAAVLAMWLGGLFEVAPEGGYRLVGVDGRDIVLVGEELVARARATLRIGRIGRVEIEPDTRLRVDDAGGEVHRLFVERGTVRAKIWAPPRVFEIGTPAGDTIDLGCEYELTVDDDGSARVRVTDGQIAFELDGREVYVPEGASCTSLPDWGPLAPVFDDADPEFVAAVRAVELDPDPDPTLLERAVSIDRREDGLTLWHVFTSPRASAELRERVFVSLTRLFPMPQGVTAAGVRAGDAEMCERWVARMKWSWR